MSNKKTLSQLAALLCKDKNYLIWLDRRRAYKAGIDVPDGTHTEQCGRDFILQACGIKSRAELDTNQQAAGMYKHIYHLQRRYWQRQKQKQRYGRA